MDRDRISSLLKFRFLGPIVFFTVFGCAVWVGYSALQAQYELNKIRVQLVELQNLGSELTTAQLADTIADARIDAHQANSHASGFAWWLIKKLPFLGRTPTAVQTTTRNLDAVLQQSGKLEQELRKSDESSNNQINAKLIASLLSTTESFKRPIEAGAQEFSQLNYSGVPSFVAKPIQQIGNGFNSLAPLMNDGAMFANVAPVLFGIDKPRTWMLVFLNGAEARATGGFPGGWGLLQAKAGKLSLSSLNNDVKINVNPLQNWQQYASTDQVQLYGDDLSRWSDLGLSPDFPLTARLMVALLKQNEGLTVDGVFSFNEHALAGMLRATGPIKHGTRSLNAENVERYVTRDIYADYPDARKKNRAVLDIIQKVFDELSSGKGGPLRVFQAVIPPMSDGNIQLWSSDASTQQTIAKTTAGNDTSNLDNPTHALALINGAGNKIDAYVTTEVQYTQGICLTDVPYRDSYFRVDLKNDAPTSGLPAYVIPRSDLKLTSKKNHGSTRMIAYIHAPLGSTFNEATINNKSVKLVGSGIDNGRQVWRFDVEILSKSESVLFVSFNEPAVGDEPAPKLWTQSMPIPVRAITNVGPRCVR